MPILVIGASGTIGRAVTTALADRGHTVRTASRSTGTDIADVTSLPPLDVDAVVCCAASGGLTRIDDGSDEQFLRGLHDNDNFWGAIPQTPGTAWPGAADPPCGAAPA